MSSRWCLNCAKCIYRKKIFIVFYCEPYTRCIIRVYCILFIILHKSTSEILTNTLTCKKNILKVPILVTNKKQLYLNTFPDFIKLMNLKECSTTTLDWMDSIYWLWAKEIRRKCQKNHKVWRVKDFTTNWSFFNNIQAKECLHRENRLKDFFRISIPAAKLISKITTSSLKF